MKKQAKASRQSDKRHARRSGTGSFKNAIITKSGRYLLPSPAKSATTRVMWSKAFANK